MNRLRRAFEPFFGVDLRALAAFRIGLGLCVLFDVLQRATPLHEGTCGSCPTNRQHGGDRNLASLEFVRVVKTLVPPYGADDYERQPVWRHDRFG